MISTQTRLECKLINNEYMTIDDVYEKYKKIIYKVAHKYKYYGKSHLLEYGDLIGYGAEGLIKAYNHYDNEKGFKFATLATRYIKWAIDNKIRDFGVNISFSRDVKLLVNNIRLHGFENESIETIMNKFKVKKFEVEYALMILKGAVVSMDKKIDRNEKIMDLHEGIGECDDLSNPYVDEFISNLPKIQRDILDLISKNVSQKEIGKRIGMAQSHVSRNLNQIKKKYNEHVKQDKLKEK